MGTALATAFLAAASRTGEAFFTLISLVEPSANSVKSTCTMPSIRRRLADLGYHLYCSICAIRLCQIALPLPFNQALINSRSCRQPWQQVKRLQEPMPSEPVQTGTDGLSISLSYWLCFSFGFKHWLFLLYRLGLLDKFWFGLFCHRFRFWQGFHHWLL